MAEHGRKLLWFRYDMTEVQVTDLYISLMFDDLLLPSEKMQMEKECLYLLELHEALRELAGDP